MKKRKTTKEKPTTTTTMQDDWFDSPLSFEGEYIKNSFIYKEETNPKDLISNKLPETSDLRKAIPIATGVIDYFPLALVEVAKVSVAGNKKHAPGEPLHWVREASRDHADCLVRHLIERGTIDSDGERHTAKVAWRALALLQEEMENANQN